jgi:hypothetical protein
LGSQYTDVQRPAMELKMDALNIFFNRQEVLTRTPWFTRSLFILCFSLYCCVHSPSVGFALHFSFTL